MTSGFVNLAPRYFLNENWQVLQPIPPEPALKATREEEDVRRWIESTRIEVAQAADTTKIGSDERYDYLKSELGMNIIVPRGGIREMRFKVTLRGGGEISDEVVAIDGFPKDVIRESEIVGGRIKLGVTNAFKFIPVVGDMLPDLLQIDLNPWEFRLGSAKKVLVDFGGGLTFQPEWYFREDGIGNDLRVALTIRKTKGLEDVEGEITAGWIYDEPGILNTIKRLFGIERIGTDGKSVRIN